MVVVVEVNEVAGVAHPVLLVEDEGVAVVHAEEASFQSIKCLVALNKDMNKNSAR